MSTVYVDGGASGGITKVIHDDGRTWFDSRATGVKIKVAGWSAHPAVAGRFTVTSESSPTGTNLRTR